MNDIESDAENPNKAIERTADACRKAYDITHPANMHRFPHSADGDVRRHAHRWRWATTSQLYTFSKLFFTYQMFKLRLLLFI